MLCLPITLEPEAGFSGADNEEPIMDEALHCNHCWFTYEELERENT